MWLFFFFFWGGGGGLVYKIQLNILSERRLARVAQRERFNVALRSAFLTLCNEYASKKRFFVTVRCATITFLFKICIHT